ncbi:hypothetical protein [Actinacidiphila reveromycinica]|uniref:hypothetical protein n=1 Tax=Actinacidiphila reveromycinica TaxID=659352 RepID=UPI001924E708|nr:hypothetical protein [Streptomyces sp. SN-593]
MCSKHYYRWRTHGDPLKTIMRSPGGLLAELQAAAHATGDECIIMRFTGRPFIDYEGTWMNASRAVWTIRHGDPGERHVLHTCHRGEEGCISIRHLYAGDNAQNMRDKVEAGRSARGELNAKHKLTAPQVQEIRRLIAAGQSYRVIGERYGVTKKSIGDIGTGKTWSWLPPKEGPA